MNSNKRSIFLIIISTFLTRVIFYISGITKGMDKIIPSDTIHTYLPIARNIFSVGKYSSSVSPPYIPDAFVPPLYPILLGICRNIHLLIILQIGISLLFAFFIYKFGKEIFNEKTGFYASLIFSISPGFIYYSLLPLPDFIYAFFLFLALYYLWRKKFLITGIMIGLGILLKPIGFLPLLLFSIFILWKRYWKGILKFFIPITILLSPWYVRNKITFHHLSYSALPAYSLLYTDVAILKAYINNVPFTTRENDPALDSISINIEKEIPYTANNMEMTSKWRSYALMEILSHPYAYIKISTKGAIFTALGTNVKYLLSFIPHYNPVRTGVTTALLKGNIKETLVRLRKNGIPLVFIFLEIIGIVLLWILSIYGLLNFNDKGIGIMILLLSLLTILIPGPVGNGRFRLPIESLLYLFGIAGWLNKFKK